MRERSPRPREPQPDRPCEGCEADHDRDERARKRAETRQEVRVLRRLKGVQAEDVLGFLGAV